MTSPAIRVTDLTLQIAGRTIIDNLNLEVDTGDSLGLVGPNGAGKTTLYRLLLGLARPSRGTIMVHDAPVPRRTLFSEVGYMAQDEALYRDLTVEENLRFFGSLYQLDRHQLRKRVDEVLELVNLSDRRRSRVESLSGGMRRRTSLAVAILHAPRLLLLDEPTVGVDPALRVALWQEFMHLNQQGTTILVSTHHLDEANRCRRLALLRTGQLLACDTPDALMQQTATDSVEAAFLALAGEGIT